MTGLEKQREKGRRREYTLSGGMYIDLEKPSTGALK
jgi:hypothetical protein